MSVKRYGAHTNIDDFKSDWHESKDGPMVKYEDYAALEAKCAALAAEMAWLKKFCKDAAFDADYEAELGMERGGFTDALNNIKTPATDAFLAEVRAQGVESFAESQKEYVRKNRNELDSMTRAAYCGSAVDAERFAAQLRKGVQS